MIHEAENMKRNSRNVDDIKELKDNSKCKADKIRIAVNQFKEILGNGAPPMPRKVYGKQQLIWLEQTSKLTGCQ